MKTIISILLALATINSFAQTSKKQIDKVSTQDTNAVAYRLFPTQNMWTFIKLNTRNGQMWQVQFGMEKDNRFTTYLSFDHLIPKEDEVNGRFTLYTTQNMYSFILLDQIDGKTWQVQWSSEPEKRMIIPIE